MSTLIILLVFFSTFFSSLSAAPPQEKQKDIQSKLRKQIDPTNEKSIYAKVKVNNGLIYLNKHPDNQLFNGEFLFTERPPAVSYEVVGDEGRLAVKFGKGKKKSKEIDYNDDNISIDWDDRYNNECYLNFSDQLPISFNMDCGFVKGQMDFGGLKVEECMIKTAVSKSEITFSEPNPITMDDFEIDNGVGKLIVKKICNANFEEFEFEAGAGSYELYFDGELRQNGEVDIEVGVGKMDIFLPRDVGIRVRVDKSFLSTFYIDDIYKASDSEYYNDKWGKDSPSLDIYIECGVGKVAVMWLD